MYTDKQSRTRVLLTYAVVCFEELSYKKSEAYSIGKDSFQCSFDGVNKEHGKKSLSLELNQDEFEYVGGLIMNMANEVYNKAIVFHGENEIKIEVEI